jgi:hypothetical protein
MAPTLLWRSAWSQAANGRRQTYRNGQVLRAINVAMEASRERPASVDVR